MNNTAVLNNQTVVDIQKTNKTDVLAVIAKARYYLPILATVGTVLAFVGGKIGILLGALFILIGFVAALTVCPLKLMGLPIKCGLVGFKVCRGFIPVYGVADLCAAIFGMTGGIMVGMAVAFCAPAIFTLKKLHGKCEE